MSTTIAPIAAASNAGALSLSPTTNGTPSSVQPEIKAVGVVDRAEIARQISELEAQTLRLKQADEEAAKAEAKAAEEKRVAEAAKRKADLLAGLSLIGITKRADAEAILLEAFGPVTAAPRATVKRRAAKVTTAKARAVAKTPVRKGTKAKKTRHRHYGAGPIPAAVKAKAIEMMKDGCTEVEIVKQLHISPAVSAIWRRDAGLANIGLGGRNRVTYAQLVEQGVVKRAA